MKLSYCGSDWQHFRGLSLINWKVKYVFQTLSMSWFFDFPRPEGKEGAASSLDDLETHTRKITLGVARSTETSDEYLVVLVDESHTTISWDVGSDLLVVFSQLDSDTLSDGRVWLLGLYSNLLDDDTCSMGSLSEWLLPL